MRLLIATDSFEPKIDGVAETAGMLVRALTARGHEVAVAAPSPGGDVHGVARVVRLPSLPMPLYPEVRVAYRIDVLSRAIRAFRPDAAIVLTVGPVGVWAMRALPPSVPIVHIYTTDMPGYLKAYRAGFMIPGCEMLLRWMAERSLATLAPTEVIRSDLAGRGLTRLDIWGRGVDTALFHPGQRDDATRARLTGGEPARPLVLYVGRLAREKRILDLLEATRQLRDARFALVGDGPQRTDLERLFPPERTVFTGYLRGRPLAQAFASADVFAFPSDTDTFAQVVLQSMASGVPAVVASETAPSQLVPHEVAGLHAPARSPHDLATAIGRVIGDPAFRARLSAGAIEAVAGRSWDALVERLEGMLADHAALATGVPVGSARRAG